MFYHRTAEEVDKNYSIADVRSSLFERIKHVSSDMFIA
jgi:hypothetical protein